MDLGMLQKEIKQCTKCALRENATTPVPGIGAPKAKYFILGEAPGRNEDSCATPFVGLSGRRLNKLLELAGIDINDCYLTNVCKCRPPANRTPRKAERLTCYPWLSQELELVGPKIIITLGATPLSLFTEQGISQLHGTSFEKDGRTIIAQYHPAAALHAPRLWATMLNDWQTMPDRVDASFTIVPEDTRFPTSCEFISMDTENDPNGKLGYWSEAFRDEHGQLMVLPHCGSLPNYLTGAGRPVVMHNARWDIRVLRANSMPTPKPDKVIDSLICAYCLGMGRQEPKDSSNGSGDNMVGGLGLKYLARRHLGLEMKTWEQVKDKPELVPEYNAMDSVATYLLFEKWKPKLPQHFWDIDMPLLDVLMTMEDRGFMVDPDFLRKYAESVDVELSKIDLKDINPFSYKQKADYVYGTLGIKPTHFTKNKQPSVDKEVLETIDDPLVRAIVSYTELSKEKNTYIANYTTRLDENNRIHCEFKQTSTATGRLSSARPNLQNVTKSTDLRKLFIAPEGMLLVVADWKLLEFGMLAAIAQDPVLIKAFTSGDVHQETADALGVDRDTGKHINFLMQNGGTPWGMSRTYGIPIDKAKHYFDLYFRRFPAIARFHEKVVEEAKATKEVIGIFGRRRRLDALFAEDWRVRLEGEREAKTMPMQNGAAELVKRAMIDLHYKHHAPMLSQVHDEIIFEIPERDALEYAHWLKAYLPQLTIVNDVRFPVEVGIGKNWWEAKRNVIS